MNWACYLRRNRVELPLVGDALQCVGAAIGEGDARARDQVLHGAGDEDLAGTGDRRDPCADVDGDAADVVVAQLNLSASSIQTEIRAATTFWLAEDHHQRYIAKGGEHRCHVFTRPVAMPG